MIHTININEVVNSIALNYQPEKIFLFGSYVSGNPTGESDLDFIIVKNTSTPKCHRGREIRKFLYGFLVPMDLKVYTPIEFEKELKSNYSFLSSVIKHSKLLYERKR